MDALTLLAAQAGSVRRRRRNTERAPAALVGIARRTPPLIETADPRVESDHAFARTPRRLAEPCLIDPGLAADSVVPHVEPRRASVRERPS
jgi:hypothetical protein